MKLPNLARNSCRLSEETIGEEKRNGKEFELMQDCSSWPGLFRDVQPFTYSRMAHQGETPCVGSLQKTDKPFSDIEL